MNRLVEIVQAVNPRIKENDTEIVSGGILDSIELVEIVSEIEMEFDIEIPMDDISPENFNSISAMWEMIERLK